MACTPIAGYCYHIVVAHCACDMLSKCVSSYTNPCALECMSVSGVVTQSMYMPYATNWCTPASPIPFPGVTQLQLAPGMAGKFFIPHLVFFCCQRSNTFLHLLHGTCTRTPTLTTIGSVCRSTACAAVSDTHHLSTLALWVDCKPWIDWQQTVWSFCHRTSQAFRKGQQAEPPCWLNLPHPH